MVAKRMLGALALLGAIGWSWLYGADGAAHVTVCLGSVSCQHVN